MSPKSGVALITKSSEKQNVHCFVETSGYYFGVKLVAAEIGGREWYNNIVESQLVCDCDLN